MSPAARHLISAGLVDDVIEACWNDDGRNRYHPIWSRDNCRCEDCGDPAIGYRLLRLQAATAAWRATRGRCANYFDPGRMKRP